MPDRCVLSFDNLRVLPKSYFVERICALDSERMTQVCRALSRRHRLLTPCCHGR